MFGSGLYRLCALYTFLYNIIIIIIIHLETRREEQNILQLLVARKVVHSMDQVLVNYRCHYVWLFSHYITKCLVINIHFLLLLYQFPDPR